MNKQRYLIVHRTDGIFLGECLGLGFCSKLDPAGQTQAVTFESIENCVDYLSKWTSVRQGFIKLQELTFVPCSPSDGMYASIQDCIDAGLEGWDPGEIGRMTSREPNLR